MTSLTTRDITSQTTKFIKALHTAKAIESELQAFYAHIEAEMQQHGVQSVKGDWGSLSLATRKTWHGDNLPTRFYKQVLDTTKLNHLFKAGEKLPTGASYTETEYLVKRLK